jgi:hypothetical protein
MQPVDAFEPVRTWHKKFLFKAKECIVTGEKIPAFTTAYRRTDSYYIRDRTDLSYIRDIVQDQHFWYSEKGYAFHLLQKKKND